MSTLEHQRLAQEHRPKTVSECKPAVLELVALGHPPATVAELLKLPYDDVMTLLAAA